MKTINPINYRGHEIRPKRDFPFGSKEKGFVVCQGICNVMPGGTWFKTRDEAVEAIDVLLEVKGDAGRFWEIMQPFEYTHIGQKTPGIENGSCECGRNKAVIEGGKVVKLTRVNRRGKLIVHTARGTR